MNTQTRKLKENFRSLSSYTGDSSALISIYLPNKPGTMAKLSALLTNELSASSNIKSAATRNAVQEGLRSIRAHTKGMH